MAAKPSLLVVDDEENILESVHDLLRMDFKVLGAKGASECFQVMQKQPVQIIMSDQVMPEMSGVELLQRVKQSHPDTVRLLFTGFANLETIIEAINQGNIYRYISKPWKADELKAILRQAAEYYTLHEEKRRLMQEVHQKNEQLEAANAELRRANELKHAFIKVASHELHTPLAILLGYSELAVRSTVSQPELQGWLERIMSAGSRLNDRVDLMVKLMMAGRFERPLQPRAVDIAELLRRAAAEVASFVRLRQLSLRLDVPDDLGTAEVEADKVLDSIVQLLINAIKFTPDGGTVILSASRTPQGRLLIRVTDTGMGIDPESQSRIFEPFFTRFDVSRHSSGTYEYDKRGLGLGLSVAKAFIEMHGGEIRVESKLGQGTTFTIDLPGTHDKVTR